jgi:thiol:disulfide interchange protein DsbD
MGLAQNANPVKWTFSSKKGNNPHEYVLVATAKIQDGFHVFAPEPGGDGLLIPTEVAITNKTAFKKIGHLTPTRRPVTKNMEGIGMVNYYEGEIEFNLTVETDKPGSLSGTMSFQCCNDQMCLPPTDVPFKVKL